MDHVLNILLFFSCSQITHFPLLRKVREDFTKQYENKYNPIPA